MPFSNVARPTHDNVRACGCHAAGDGTFSAPGCHAVRGERRVA